MVFPSSVSPSYPAPETDSSGPRSCPRAFDWNAAADNEDAASRKRTTAFISLQSHQCSDEFILIERPYVIIAFSDTDEEDRKIKEPSYLEKRSALRG